MTTFLPKKIIMNVQLQKLNYKITDHLPIFIALNINNDSHIQNYKSIIDYKKLSVLSQNINWNEIMQTDNVNMASELLINNIKKIICLSTKRIKLNKKNKSRKNWITNGLKQSCRIRQKLYKIWQSDLDNQVHEQNYKNYSRLLTKILNIAKSNYEKNLVSNYNSKSIWRFVNNKLNNNCKQKKFSY